MAIEESSKWEGTPQYQRDSEGEKREMFHP
jgi:hypothetical protein